MNMKRAVKHLLTLSIFLSVLAGSVLSVTPVFAAPITVSSFDDVVDPDDGFCTLREAITSSNSDSPSGSAEGECPAGSGADEIILPEGTYTLDSQLPFISSGITITGVDGGTTIIQASTCNPVTLEGGCTPVNYRIFEVSTAGTLTLNYLIVQHGSFTTDLSDGGGIQTYGVVNLVDSVITANKAGFGGGIRTTNTSTLNLTRSVVDDNQATLHGGGIYSAGNLSIDSSDILNNAAFFGAGLFVKASGSFNILTSDFSNNTASNDGGGIVNYSDNSLNVITDSTLSGNSARRGGGIVNIGDGVLTLDDVDLKNNVTTSHGGGISNEGSLTMEKSELSDNVAGGTGLGGGIYNFPTGIINLVGGNRILRNTANYGGGIYNDSTDPTNYIAGSEISDNSSNMGGGIYNDTDAVLSLESSSLVGNETISGIVNFGGGIYNDGTLDVLSSLIAENVSEENGGGIANITGNLTIKNSTLQQNSAEYGGGINNIGLLTVENTTFHKNTVTNSGGGIRSVLTDLNIHNSTFSENTANSEGGGIHALSGTLDIKNCTFSGNGSKDYAGGIYLSGTGSVLNLANTIVANSLGVDPANPASDKYDCFISVGSMGVDIHNLIGKVASSSNACGTPYLSTDPLLDVLAENGGPTQTFALLEDSPAIDAGDMGICTALPVNNLDQRGVKRPQGMGCDIGAFELEWEFFNFLPLILR